MPQTLKNGKYHPCNCGICFFCKNSFTSSIAHGKVSSRPEVVECSNDYDFVRQNWCVVCCKVAKVEHPDKNTAEKRKLKIIKQSRRGCSTCGVDGKGAAVCTDHWENFDHSH